MNTKAFIIARACCFMHRLIVYLEAHQMVSVYNHLSFFIIILWSRFSRLKCRYMIHQLPTAESFIKMKKPTIFVGIDSFYCNFYNGNLSYIIIELSMFCFLMLSYFLQSVTMLLELCHLTFSFL